MLLPVRGTTDVFIILICGAFSPFLLYPAHNLCEKVLQQTVGTGRKCIHARVSTHQLSRTPNLGTQT